MLKTWEKVYTISLVSDEVVSVKGIPGGVIVRIPDYENGEILKVVN